LRLLIRLDDFTPNRNVAAWQRVEAICDSLQIKPLVACVPDDRHFGTTPTTETFWKDVRALQAKGWAIGLHGETHTLAPISRGCGREIFFATASEFVGLPEEAQYAKLSRAWNAFVGNGVRPVAFVAPNHGFDAVTVRALIKQGQLEIISDGVAVRPFRDRGLIWLPQIDWRVPLPFMAYGFRTACMHPESMDARELRIFEKRARRARRSIISMDDVARESIGSLGRLDAVFAGLFAAYFNVRESLYRLRQRAYS
jgi:hypothetical protein